MGKGKRASYKQRKKDKINHMIEEEKKQEEEKRLRHAVCIYPFVLLYTSSFLL